MQPVSENSGINLTKPPTVYGMDLINGAHMTSQPAFPGQPYGGNKITYEQVDPSTFEDEDSDDDCHGSMPKPGKKTKGRVKIKMEFIENKLRRYTTFSKRKTGIMKKVGRSRLTHIWTSYYTCCVLICVIANVNIVDYFHSYF